MLSRVLCVSVLQDRHSALLLVEPANGKVAAASHSLRNSRFPGLGFSGGAGEVLGLLEETAPLTFLNTPNS